MQCPALLWLYIANCQPSSGCHAGSLRATSSKSSWPLGRQESRHVQERASGVAARADRPSCPALRALPALGKPLGLQKFPIPKFPRQPNMTQANARICKILAPNLVRCKAKAEPCYPEDSVVKLLGILLLRLGLRITLASVRPIEIGHVWFSEEAVEGKGVGEEVDVVGGHGVSIQRKVGVVPYGAGCIKVRLVKVEEGPAFSERLLSHYMDCLQDQMPANHPPAKAGLDKVERDRPAVDEEEPEDARVLAVDCDSQGDRFKEYKEGLNARSIALRIGH